MRKNIKKIAKTMMINIKVNKNNEKMMNRKAKRNKDYENRYKVIVTKHEGKKKQGW